MPNPTPNTVKSLLELAKGSLRSPFSRHSEVDADKRVHGFMPRHLL